MAETAAATDKDTFESSFKVSLRTINSYPNTNQTSSSSDNVSQTRGRHNTSHVTFDVTPEITETRSVDYKTYNPVHMPGQIFTYGGSSSRSYSVSGIKLISRTIAEATRNMQTLWTLRGWTMPYFGERSSTLSFKDAAKRRTAANSSGLSERADGAPSRQQIGQELLGKPPEVLLLNAYSSVLPSESGTRRSFPTNISNIPVVLIELAIPYPADVDYIPTENGQPFPRVMSIDLQLKETRAPIEMSQRFSLQDYRQGLLSGF